MELTKAGDYGYLGVLYLAKQPKDRIVRLSEISESEGIPEKFLAKIFQNLTRTGLVRSHRGAKGGFTLAKAADEITVKELIESVQGPIFLSRCLTSPNSCDRKKSCPLRKLWVKSQDYIIEMFKENTLADLMAQ
jgi:Rrf2 family transcriptional regulator, iron-sulfur cluster assembly transcription factor